LRKVIKAIKKHWREKGEIAETIHQAMMLAHLYGRYFAARMLKQKSLEHFQDIPSAYDEAIEFFKNKLVLTKKEFKKLNKEMRRQAFTIAATEKEVVLNQIKESLQNALESGQVIEDWQAQIELLFDKAGVTTLNNYYLNTIFRTNMQEALNAGKMRIFEQIDEEEFPLLEFVAIEDDRVRPEHLALNGFRARKDDPIWKKRKPPLSYNCRCTVVPVYKEEKLEPSNWRPSLTGRGFEFVN